MAIHLSGGAAIGAVILEGKHAPFRALACPLQAITMGSDESPLDSAQSRRARLARRSHYRAALAESKMLIKKAGRALPASSNSLAEQTGECSSYKRKT